MKISIYYQCAIWILLVLGTRKCHQKSHLWIRWSLALWCLFYSFFVPSYIFYTLYKNTVMGICNTGHLSTTQFFILLICVVVLWKAPIQGWQVGPPLLIQAYTLMWLSSQWWLAGLMMLRHVVISRFYVKTFLFNLEIHLSSFLFQASIRYSSLEDFYSN